MAVQLFDAVKRTQDLELFYQQIALEAGFVKNMLDRFQSIMSGLQDNLGTGLQKLSHLASISIPTRQYANQANKFERDGYLYYRDVVIKQPENFQGQFLPYTQTLVDTFHVLYPLKGSQQPSAQIFAQYQGFLSYLLTNQSAQLAAKAHTELYVKLTKERLDAQTKLKTFFPKPTGRSQVTFLRVIQRLADLLPLFRLSDQLVVLTSSDRIKLLERQTRETVSLFDLLVNRVEDGTITTLSPPVVLTLSKGAEALARHVEFVAALHYDSRVMLTVIDDLASLPDTLTKRGL